METRPDLDVGLAAGGEGGQGEIPGGHPIGSWTLRAEAWADAGIWAHGASWPKARRAATGCDVTRQAEAAPSPGLDGTACLNANKFCLQMVAGYVRVCVCVCLILG